MRVAAEAAGHDVGLMSRTPFYFGVDVIEGGVFAEWFSAVRAAVVPGGQDLFTEAHLCHLPCDEFGLVNLVVHYHTKSSNLTDVTCGY